MLELDGKWEIENGKRSGFSFLKTDELQIKLEEKKEWVNGFSYSSTYQKRDWKNEQRNEVIRAYIECCENVLLSYFSVLFQWLFAYTPYIGSKPLWMQTDPGFWKYF
jgi:hypothetical protein